VRRRLRDYFTVTFHCQQATEKYILASGEERKLFEMLLTHERVEEVYFTGSITDPAHNELNVEYMVHLTESPV
jgi:hypothetical protein